MFILFTYFYFDMELIIGILVMELVFLRRNWYSFVIGV